MKHLILLFTTTFFVLFLQPEKSASQTLETVYVLNEGAFFAGNASVTKYNPATGNVQNNVFFYANARPLGDVAQSSFLHNGSLYIVVNNSNKIEVVDPETLVATDTILIEDEAGGPNEIVYIGDGKAYVTNLSGSTISVLDLNANTEVDTFEVGPNPEGIVISGERAFVALSAFGAGNQVAVVNTETDEVETLLDVHDNPRSVYLSEDGMIWVVCTGDFGFDEDFNYDPDLETFGEIHIISPETLETETIIETGGHPGALAFNYSEQIAYLNNSGIQIIDLSTLETDGFLTETSYYSIGFADGNEPRIYGGIAPDFGSAGSVDILLTNGTIESSFTAGIGPGFFQFIYGETDTGTPAYDQPVAFTLQQNYPNPFNPTTQIRFELPESGDVSLSVYNIQGQKVSTLVNGTRSAGSHTVTFDASSLASGMYIYRMEAGNTVQTRKMMLVK